MNRFAPLFVVFAASLWGIDGILLRPDLYTLPVTLVVFLESLIIVLVLSLFFVRSFKSYYKLKRNDWLAFLGVAIMGGAVGDNGDNESLVLCWFCQPFHCRSNPKTTACFCYFSGFCPFKGNPAKKVLQLGIPGRYRRLYYDFWSNFS